MIDFIKRAIYYILPIVSKGPFGEIPEDEFDKIIEMAGDEDDNRST